MCMSVCLCVCMFVCVCVCAREGGGGGNQCYRIQTIALWLCSGLKYTQPN